MSKIHDEQRNALYTSHGIQDELLVLLAKKVVQKICQGIYYWPKKWYKKSAKV